MAENKKKQIIIGIVAVILVLNIMWTIMQNKFTPKLDAVKSDIAAVEQRMTKLENNGIPDVAELKQEFAALKEISTEFANRLTQAIKAEEENLSYLEAQVEAQKARLESLKKLASPEN